MMDRNDTVLWCQFPTPCCWLRRKSGNRDKICLKRARDRPGAGRQDASDANELGVNLGRYLRLHRGMLFPGRYQLPGPGAAHYRDFII